MTLYPIWVIMIPWIEYIHPGQPGQITADCTGAIAYERTSRKFPQCGNGRKVWKVVHIVSVSTAFWEKMAKSGCSWCNLF